MTLHLWTVDIEALIACGRVEEAQTVADELFERAPAGARARDELARVGLRRPVITEGLTPAQQRVAELVAAGMSNREIAATLYMSVRSVEAHLTKAYRELDVKVTVRARRRTRRQQ